MRSWRTGVGVAAATALVVVLAIALTAGGGSSGRASDGDPDAGAPSAPATASSAAPGATGASSGPAIPGPTAPGSTTPRALRPVRIAIPAIGVDAAITDLGISSDGSIQVPSVPSRAGWLDTTPAPGQRGPAVVAGHVDSTTGPAVFYLLSTLTAGDEVVVTRRDGSTVSFTVDGVRTYAQDAFPTRDVYGPVPGPALRLITCGGEYVRADGGYQSNVVVYAS